MKLPTVVRGCPEPERGLDHRDHAGPGHRLIVVGGAGDHVGVRIDDHAGIGRSAGRSLRSAVVVRNATSLGPAVGRPPRSRASFSRVSRPLQQGQDSVEPLSSSSSEPESHANVVKDGEPVAVIVVDPRSVDQPFNLEYIRGRVFMRDRASPIFSEASFAWKRSDFVRRQIGRGLAVLFAVQVRSRGAPCRLLHSSRAPLPRRPRRRHAAPRIATPLR